MKLPPRTYATIHPDEYGIKDANGAVVSKGWMKEIKADEIVRRVNHADELAAAIWGLLNMREDGNRQIAEKVARAALAAYRWTK